MKTNAFLRKIFLVLLGASVWLLASAQTTVKISGQVLDETGQPMIGAGVIQLGTNDQVGTVTDLDGNYSLSVPKGSSVEIRAIGYKFVSKVVNGNEIFNVQLESDSELLEETIVVGYGVQRKSDITGAISKVGEEDFTNRTVGSAAEALNGKTAGVQFISSSAAPGESPVIRVRGFSSNYSSDPLYIVDGLKMSDISNIDANDIESMEVLKDAASAAIYGAEAGNGVVLITTRRATAGKAKISYDFQYSSQSLNNMPKVLNAEQYINWYTEGGFITDEKLSTYYDGVTDTNWADVAFENSTMFKHALSFQQATDKMSVLISLNYLSNDGIVVGDHDTFERYNMSINAEIKPKKWLTVGLNSNVSYFKRESVSSNGAGISSSVMTSVLELDPLTPVYYDSDNLPSYVQSLIDGGYTVLSNSSGQYYGISQFYQSAQINPLEIIDVNTSNSSGKNIRANFYANLMPIKGLVVTSRVGVNFHSSYTRSYSKEYYCYTWATNDNPTVTQTSPQNAYWQWENFANYTKKIGKHNLGFMVGTSYSEKTAQTLTVSVDDIIKDTDSYAWIDFTSGNATKTVSGVETKTRKFSYFGRINYSFADKYIVEVSARADAADTSVLPADERWGYFPAVSLGWVASKENFFPKTENFTYLKIRGSWGQNGSIANLSDYTYAASITSDAVYPYSSSSTYSSGSYPTALGNYNLKWETSEQLDFGLDARFFKDRLSFTMDWYQKKTKDLLIYDSTPSLTAGNDPSPVNAGNVENKGWEFELTWKDSIGDFRYSVSANLSTLDNKVTYLDPTITRLEGSTGPLGSAGGGTYFEEGLPVWYMRGYHVEGIDSSTGDPIFTDYNEDGTIDANDLTYVGSGIPDVNYGITITAAYKNFDLTVFGSGAGGNQIWYAATYNNVTGANTLEYFYDRRWTSTNTDGTIARPLCTNYDKYYASDAYIFNGSYFKIKQIQLGYTVPKKLTKSWGIENIRAYFSLDDFFTFTSYPGLDPEAASLSTSSGIGIDTGYYPSSKKIVLGFNITF